MMLDVDDISLSPSQLLGHLRVMPLGTVLHLSDKPGELSQ